MPPVLQILSVLAAIGGVAASVKARKQQERAQRAQKRAADLEIRNSNVGDLAEKTGAKLRFGNTAADKLLKRGTSKAKQSTAKIVTQAGGITEPKIGGL